MAAGDAWAADVMVSHPDPLTDERPALADLTGGFVFTSGGIAHNLSTSEMDEVFTPTYAPGQG